MKIIVAIKQVPERDTPIRLTADARGIEERDVKWAMNEADAYALEEALQLKDKHSGEVIVVSAGPERVTSTLREALAKGADRAIHVDCAPTPDPFATAQLLAGAVRDEAADLILTGLQSDDAGHGQTGVILAELLGLPHATLILHIDASDTGFLVKRELEQGWFQQIEVPRPALLAIQSGGAKPRYATLMGIKRARAKEVRVVKPEALPAPTIELVRISEPKKSKQTVMLTGTAKESAAALIEKLKFEARVL